MFPTYPKNTTSYGKLGQQFHATEDLSSAIRSQSASIARGQKHLTRTVEKISFLLGRMDDFLQSIMPLLKKEYSIQNSSYDNFHGFTTKYLNKAYQQAIQEDSTALFHTLCTLELHLKSIRTIVSKELKERSEPFPENSSESEEEKTSTVEGEDSAQPVLEDTDITQYICSLENYTRHVKEQTLSLASSQSNQQNYSFPFLR